MSNQTEITHSPDLPDFAPRLVGIALLLFCLVAGGLWLVAGYTAADQARDVQVWQEKLDILAENRATDVDRWLADRFKALRDMAGNPSLQLYMSDLQAMKEPAVDGGEPPQKTYLRNLLLFTAERAGFANAGVPSIPASLPPPHVNALAIIGAGGDVIAATPMTAATRDLMLASVKQSAPGREGLIDLRKDKDGTLYIGFIVPVFSIQGDHTANSQVARVVGIQAVGDSLFNLLKSPGVADKTLETILVRAAGGKVDYLSPLQDGTRPLDRHEALDAGSLASAALLAMPGQFVSDLKDYRGRIVLATSRAISGAPWMLVTKIDRDEALAAGSQRRAGMEIIFFLVIAVITLIIAAIWWRAYSRRAVVTSAYFRHLAAQTAAQERLLRLVTDHQPEPVYIVDAGHVVRFANRQAEEEARMSQDSLPGKTLADVRGAARAAKITECCDRALGMQQIFYDMQRLRQGEDERVIRSAYVPLDHIPLASLPEPTPGVLVVEQDVSDVVHEREKRLEILHQLMRMLLKLVDARDPFAANHSLLVSQIAQEVAIEMGLDGVLVETARIAGSLMNIGKIVVPTELLTKTGNLSAGEKQVICESMNAAADLIANIRFDGPVAETLRQWQEKWDGSGPLAVKGEAILITARIIAVANAFIGMTSPRSWRTAMAIEAANKFLLDQAGAHFDRRVVIALINYIENHNGKAWLKKVLESQKSAA
ncbi:MAG: PAS domain-containing protein [Pseudomonadota bacterium]|nr:PAS domain-containing protein [Pseudomonadota bacterium]MDE3037317.1 PAS domain-containing protein [Pseudomonadota bacterium]